MPIVWGHTLSHHRPAVGKALEGRRVSKILRRSVNQRTKASRRFGQCLHEVSQWEGQTSPEYPPASTLSVMPTHRDVRRGASADYRNVYGQCQPAERRGSRPRAGVDSWRAVPSSKFDRRPLGVLVSLHRFVHRIGCLEQKPMGIRYNLCGIDPPRKGTFVQLISQLSAR